jgi:hypothetical protein
MHDNRVVKIVKDTIPAGRRCPGWPHKRWRDDITLTQTCTFEGGTSNLLMKKTENKENGEVSLM